MEVQLRREVKVGVLEVLLDVSRPSRRRELHSVLLRAREQRNGATAEDICDHLLHGRPAIVGLNLLRRCVELGLLVPHAVDEETIDKSTPHLLTEAGELALREEEVFLPETGRYRLWLGDDPLLPSPLLSLQAVDEPGVKDGQNVASIQPPAALRGLEGHVVRLPGKDAGRVRVDRIQSSCLPQPPDQRVEVTWALSETSPPKVSLTGKVPAELPPPRLAWDRVWAELLGPRRSDWVRRAAGPALSTAFSDPGLSDPERARLLRTLAIERPRVAGYGDFDRTQVREVPLTPATNEDAQEWAVWLLVREADHHIRTDEFETLSGKLSLRFPDHRLRLPSQAALARAVAEKARRGARDEGAPSLPPHYWFLQTPLDVPGGP